ncbi:uncharacterized protein Pyn_24289 [Prunus yedoensis var. nudiflora]|uniref:F-box domain-containing protein n=1 Tax=Prunus yedoensis var. nudiflora TaxID=2094558 RepID=A0A314XU45_PRUYE|nr:uncharacterized protein Pyn_24289 [Prunus yedoensis var. nudiflora]
MSISSQSVQLKDDEYNLDESGKRRKIIKDDEHKVVEDRISELPYEVIVSIVSLLPLKEAVATSILSRRWRYVWSSTTTLNLETVNFEDPETLRYFCELDYDKRDQEAGHKYVNWVNHVLEQHRGQSIERFRNAPLLVDVTYYKLYTYAEFTRIVFGQLSPCLSHIEILKLDIREAVYNQNHVLPILANLRDLQLLVDADYHWSLGRLASFMKAAPYMQRLVLGLDLKTSNTKTAKIEKAAECPHYYLKEVEISGYRGHKCCVKHVMYLKKNALALEKIVINPARFWCAPTGYELNVLAVNEEDNARDHAIQYLKQKMPCTIEYVCLY